MKAPFREGDELTVTPIRIGRRGEAEAEHAGWRVRVRGGLPEEEARVRVVHVSRGGPVAVADLVAPLIPHAARRAPPCPIHDPCGGCGLQHVGEAAALDAKIAQARAALPTARAWDPPLASPRAFGYRAKTFLLPQARAGRLLLGARPPRGPDLVDTSGCGVLRPELEALAARVRAELAERVDLAPRLRSVMLRCTRAGATQATLVHAGAPDGLAEIARRLGADAAFLQRHDAPGNLVCSQEEETCVAGDGPIVERFDDVEATVPPTAFLQANPEVAEGLYRAAAADLAGPLIGELYCGSGVAGLLALRRHPDARLEAVDRSPRAVAAARANAAANGLEDRASFRAVAAEDAAGDWDTVLVNPPRAGCAAGVLEAVARGPARVLVYLSCNAQTLARDAARLAGWTLDAVRPADMLPQTPHLELLARFTR